MVSGKNEAIRQKRRRDIIEASIRVIADHGYAGTTVSRVAKEAGVSTGLIGFHFTGKSQLFEAVFDQLSNEFFHTVNEAMSGSRGPLQKLLSFIESYFGTIEFTPARASVWFTFWSDTNLRDKYKPKSNHDEERFSSIFTDLLTSAIAAELAMPPDESAACAQDIFLPLNAMMDGFWLQAMLNPARSDVKTSARSCVTFLLQSLHGLAADLGARGPRVLPSDAPAVRPPPDGAGSHG